MLAALYLSAPDGWGWNPATVQAIGSIAVFGSLAVALWAIFHTLGEAALRTRPWIGITGCKYARGLGADGEPGEMLTFTFHNVGLLPAHSLWTRDISVGVAEGDPVTLGYSGPINDYFELDGRPLGTVFPNEPGLASLMIDGERLARFSRWREESRQVLVRASFSYELGRHTYSTGFRIIVRFGETEAESGEVLINWANEAAT